LHQLTHYSTIAAAIATATRNSGLKRLPMSGRCTAMRVAVESVKGIVVIVEGGCWQRIASFP
jgi:hypothetical protein